MSEARIWAGIGEVWPIAPAIYRDKVGNVHVDTGALLEYFRVEDKPAHRQAVADAFAGAALEFRSRLRTEPLEAEAIIVPPEGG